MLKIDHVRTMLQMERINNLWKEKYNRDWTEDDFVWGIKVPVGIAHASEKVLFSTAYPKFKEWVESDGAKNKDWYLHPAAGKVIRYW